MAVLARAPTLAWLLTALACFLAGMAVAEGQSQALAPLAPPPVGVVVTVEVAYPATAPHEVSATPAAPCGPVDLAALRPGCNGNVR
jgi:hypothetical protein